MEYNPGRRELSFRMGRNDIHHRCAHFGSRFRRERACGADGDLQGCARRWRSILRDRRWTKSACPDRQPRCAGIGACSRVCASASLSHPGACACNGRAARYFLLGHHPSLIEGNPKGEKTQTKPRSGSVEITDSGLPDACSRLLPAPTRPRLIKKDGVPD